MGLYIKILSTPVDPLTMMGAPMTTLTNLVPTDTLIHQRIELLAKVNFKWLMAGQGCWIDPRRLRADRVYAQDCLVSALNSGCEPLRRCAQLLQNQLRAVGLT
jgi:hypothetical protein